MSRQNRRDRKNGNDRAPQAPAPPANPTPGAADTGAQPRNVFAIVLGLVILVVGGGFLIFYLTGRGPGGPSGPNPQVIIETSEGPIKVELFEREAPITVKNFLTYVDEKFYDGTIFHRVMPDFMIQGGGFTPDMKEKPNHGLIKNESSNGLKNNRATLAMARTPNPDSASAQFFINLKDNAFLNRENAQDRVGYAVFGKVIAGMDMVDKIGAVETADRGLHEHVPVKDVIIKSVRRVETK